MEKAGEWGGCASAWRLNPAPAPPPGHRGKDKGLASSIWVLVLTAH